MIDVMKKDASLAQMQVGPTVTMHRSRGAIVVWVVFKHQPTCIWVELS